MDDDDDGGAKGKGEGGKWKRRKSFHLMNILLPSLPMYTHKTCCY